MSKEVFELGVSSDQFSLNQEEDEGVIISGPTKRKRVEIEEEDSEELPDVESEEPALQKPKLLNLSEKVPEKELSEEEKESIKRKAVMLIKLYLTKFKDKLSDLKIKVDKLANKEIDDLNRILEDIRFMLGCSSNSGMVDSLSQGALALYEKALVSMEWQVTGISRYLEKDQEWKDLMVELELEWIGLSSLPPGQRAAMKLLRSSYQLHQANSILHGLPAANTKNVDPSLLEKWKDL